MKVSVIVPVYNAENSVERTIKSILEQTYSNLQLLLVDDGSTDNSLMICENYMRLDARVNVFHQENKGPSAARNLGLENVTGDLLTFADADDVFHKDAFDKLVKIMKETDADVCVFGWNFIYTNNSIKKYIFEKDEMVDDIRDVYSKIFWKPYYCGGGNPWNKIWKVDKLKVKGQFIMFDTSISIYEDFLWTLKNYELISKVVFENSQLYDYYILDTSISRAGMEIVRREKFYQGAKKVIMYIRDFKEFAYLDALGWYRNRMVAFLYAKYKRKVDISASELQEIKAMPVLPMKHDKIRAWIKYIYTRCVVK